MSEARVIARTALYFCLLLSLHNFVESKDISGCCTNIRIASKGEAINHQSNRVGDYSLSGILSERPIYKHSAREEFLFYLTSRNKGLWMVGPKAAQFNGGLAHRGDKTCVEDVAEGEWKYTDGSTWNVDPLLTVSCIDEKSKPECTYNDGVQFVGGDLPSEFGGGGIQTSMNSSAECIEECEKRAGCLYWTWAQQEGPNCFLKVDKVQSVRRPKFVSGSIPSACIQGEAPSSEELSVCTHKGIDFVGGDLFNTAASSADDCRKQCAGHESCQLFSYFPEEDNGCYLKTEAVWAQVSENVVSGAIASICEEFVLPHVSTVASETSVYNPNQINGKFKILMDFHEELNNPESEEFNELSGTLEKYLLDMLQSESDLNEQATFDVRVESFKPGSVVCNFKVNYILKEAYLAIPFAIKPSNITDAMNKNFKLKKGVLFQRFLIAAGSFKSATPVDHCDAKGCSHKCNYDYDVEDYVCTCPRDLTLGFDLKTCVDPNEDQEVAGDANNANARDTTTVLPVVVSLLPSDCLWSSWSDWSTCDCETGSKERSRTIAIPAKNGGVCSGEYKEFEECIAEAGACNGIKPEHTEATEKSETEEPEISIVTEINPQVKENLTEIAVTVNEYEESAIDVTTESIDESTTIEEIEQENVELSSTEGSDVFYTTEESISIEPVTETDGEVTEHTDDLDYDGHFGEKTTQTIEETTVSEAGLAIVTTDYQKELTSSTEAQITDTVNVTPPPPSEEDLQTSTETEIIAEDNTKTFEEENDITTLPASEEDLQTSTEAELTSENNTFEGEGSYESKTTTEVSSNEYYTKIGEENKTTTSSVGAEEAETVTTETLTSEILTEKLDTQITTEKIEVIEDDIENETTDEPSVEDVTINFNNTIGESVFDTTESNFIDTTDDMGLIATDIRCGTTDNCGDKTNETENVDVEVSTTNSEVEQSTVKAVDESLTNLGMNETLTDTTEKSESNNMDLTEKDQSANEDGDPSEYTTQNPETMETTDDVVDFDENTISLGETEVIEDSNITEDIEANTTQDPETMTAMKTNEKTKLDFGDSLAIASSTESNEDTNLDITETSIDNDNQLTTEATKDVMTTPENSNDLEYSTEITSMEPENSEETEKTTIESDINKNNDDYVSETASEVTTKIQKNAVSEESTEETIFPLDMSVVTTDSISATTIKDNESSTEEAYATSNDIYEETTFSSELSSQGIDTAVDDKDMTESTQNVVNIETTTSGFIEKEEIIVTSTAGADLTLDLTDTTTVKLDQETSNQFAKVTEESSSTDFNEMTTMSDIPSEAVDKIVFPTVDEQIFTTTLRSFEDSKTETTDSGVSEQTSYTDAATVTIEESTTVGAIESSEPNNEDLKTLKPIEKQTDSTLTTVEEGKATESPRSFPETEIDYIDETTKKPDQSTSTEGNMTSEEVMSDDNSNETTTSSSQESITGQNEDAETVIQNDEVESTVRSTESSRDDMMTHVTVLSIDKMEESTIFMTTVRPLEDEVSEEATTITPAVEVGGVHEFDCVEIDQEELATNSDEIPMQCTQIYGEDKRKLYIVINKAQVDAEKLFAKNVKVVIKDFMVMERSNQLRVR